MEIKLDIATHDRLTTVAGITGINIDILARHIIRDGLSRIDAGGGFSISTKDGTIKYGQGVTEIKPQKIAIERPAPADGVRELDLTGLKGM